LRGKGVSAGYALFKGPVTATGLFYFCRGAPSIPKQENIIDSSRTMMQS
jgi:hypothetical protein